MEYDGLEIALQMQNIFLALAGFVGVYAWAYARSLDLILFDYYSNLPDL